jgi:hypothetical protein
MSACVVFGQARKLNKSDGVGSASFLRRLAWHIPPSAVAFVKLDSPLANPLPLAQIRRLGGGRKSLESQDSELIEALESLVEPMSRGAPDSPLRWTCKSTRKIADELSRTHHPICARQTEKLARAFHILSAMHSLNTLMTR